MVTYKSKGMYLMLDVKAYIGQLNRVELDLLNNYLINLKFNNKIIEDDLQYSLITIDRSKNLRFQAFLCVIKKVFNYYINRYMNGDIVNYLFDNIEIFTKFSNYYNFSIEDEVIENIFVNVAKNDISQILEELHNNFLNTEIIIKNGIFQFGTSKINSKNTGSVYTRTDISNEICKKAIQNKLIKINPSADLKLLDFGSGTGRFYFEALKILASVTSKSKQEIILNNLYAIDIDEVAINILRLKALAYFEELNIDTVAKLFNNTICRNMLIIQKLSLFKASDNLFDMNNDFQNVMSKGGFDIIVSNPPYAILKVNKKDNRKQAYQKYYDELTAKINDEVNYFNNSEYYQYSTEGMLNYYKLSVEMMLNLAKKDASFGVICPATLFTDCSAKKLRRHLLLNNKVSEINYYPENANLFDKVSQATIIFYLVKNEKTDDINIKTKNDSFTVNIKDIEKSFSNLEIPYINKIGWKILNKLSGFKKLKENNEIRNKRGELDLTLYKKFITKTPTKFRLVRGNMISEDHGIIDKNNEFVLEEFFNNKSKDYLANDFNQPRLICQQISNIDALKRLNFTISDKSDIIANSCNYLTVKNKNSIKSLLVIMNSYLLNWRFKISSGNNHINNYELDELPIIECNQDFKSKDKLDLNIEICKKYTLTDEETKYILKDYYSKEELSDKLGELVNV